MVTGALGGSSAHQGLTLVIFHPTTYAWLLPEAIALRVANSIECRGRKMKELLERQEEG